MLFQLTIAKNWGQEVNTILCVKKHNATDTRQLKQRQLASEPGMPRQ